MTGLYLVVIVPVRWVDTARYRYWLRRSSERAVETRSRWAVYRGLGHCSWSRSSWCTVRKSGLALETWTLRGASRRSVAGPGNVLRAPRAAQNDQHLSNVVTHRNDN